jgi:hypothetical protein
VDLAPDGNVLQQPGRLRENPSDLALFRESEKLLAGVVLFAEKAELEDEVGLDVQPHTATSTSTLPLRMARSSPDLTSHPAFPFRSRGGSAKARSCSQDETRS